MTRDEVSEMLKRVGIPTAYYQFDEGTGQQPPFICFYYPGINAFNADDANYYAVDQLTIELYTAEKDFELEASLEAVLTAHDLPFEKLEAYIGSENMFQITYYTSVRIDTETEEENDEQEQS